MLDKKQQPDLHPYQRVERQRAALLKLIRGSFLILFFTVAALAILDTAEGEPNRVNFLGVAFKGTWQVVLTFALFIGAVALATDILTPTKKISTLVSIFFGLVVAMISTYAFGTIIDLLVELYGLSTLRDPVFLTAKVFIGIGMTYICIATVLQTQDDFRLVIPYVEFAKQIRGVRPLMIDSSALIDGRIVEVAHTGVFQAPIIVPRFIVNELQLLSDQSDSIRRARGRRGLDAISQLQREPLLDVTIDETPIAAKSVDQMLLELAQRTGSVIVTNDSGLASVSGIHDVPVLNIHNLAEACKPIAGSGEQLKIELVKQGEQEGQAVGYLEDGTMVVVNDASHLLGQKINADVESVIQTTAGRMVFAKLGHDSPEVENTPPSDIQQIQDEATKQPEHEPDEGLEDDLDSSSGPITPDGSGPYPAKPHQFRAKTAARRNPRR
jgi:uncharacterized protein YacL